MSGMSYRAVVITCSDRAAADIYEDRSGVVLRDGLANLRVTDAIVEAARTGRVVATA